jgi:hypothetical protein
LCRSFLCGCKPVFLCLCCMTLFFLQLLHAYFGRGVTSWMDRELLFLAVGYARTFWEASNGSVVNQ